MQLFALTRGVVVVALLQLLQLQLFVVVVVVLQATEKRSSTADAIPTARKRAAERATQRFLSDLEAESTSAIFFAIEHHDQESIYELMEEGIVDFKNARDDWNDGATTLTAAAYSGISYLVIWLVKDQGVDVNAVNNNGVTALIEASYMGHCEIVDILIASGANVNHASKWGGTALRGASSHGKVECMASLIRAGADVNTATVNELTSLMLAARGGNAYAVKLLLAQEGINVKAVDPGGNTALHIAAKSGAAFVVKLLLDFVDNDKEYVKAVDQGGNTALHIAAEFGAVAVVKLLMDFVDNDNEYLDQVSNFGMTALHMAAQEKYLDAVKAAGKVECMTSLIRAGADVNTANVNGFTCLMSAASGGNADAVKLLLAQEGINVKAVDQGGNTALHTALHIASRFDTVTVAKFNLLMDFVDYDKKYLDQVSNNGMTALHMAAQNGHLDAVRRLLNAGADAAIQDTKGRTALQVAAERGNYGVVDSITNIARVLVEQKRVRQEAAQSFMIAVVRLVGTTALSVVFVHHLGALVA